MSLLSEHVTFLFPSANQTDNLEEYFKTYPILFPVVTAARTAITMRGCCHTALDAIHVLTLCPLL